MRNRDPLRPVRGLQRRNQTTWPEGACRFRQVMRYAASAPRLPRQCDSAKPYGALLKARVCSVVKFAFSPFISALAQHEVAGDGRYLCALE